MTGGNPAKMRVLRTKSGANDIPMSSSDVYSGKLQRNPSAVDRTYDLEMSSSEAIQLDPCEHFIVLFFCEEWMVEIQAFSLAF